ncbi:MAG: DUF2671 domain-containing protein [Candidatus Rickettsia vulgarisii]
MEDKKTTDSKKSQNTVSPDYPFFDVQYICQATTLITDSIKKGFDIAQLPNGDISVTEIKVINVHYKWNAIRQKFVKVNS